jgi:hypothetical protein
MTMQRKNGPIVIGKSLLLCVKELRKLPLEAQVDRLKQPEWLVERVDAAWRELSLLFDIVRSGNDNRSNLWGWTQRSGELGTVFLAPYRYLRGIDWDRVESDVLEFGAIMTFELGNNCLVPKSKYDLLSQVDERDGWGFSYKRFQEKTDSAMG